MTNEGRSATQAVAQLEDGPCLGCSRKAQAAKNAKWNAEKANRKKQDDSFTQKGRLPNGSNFVACYDAEKNGWTGALHVVVDGEELVFSGFASGVTKLIYGLDDAYRASGKAVAP